MTIFKKFSRKFFLLLAILWLAGCATQNSSMTGLPVSAVNHYGEMIGVPEYYVEGNFIGNISGTGGGGTSCCVQVPEYPKAPFFLRVKWVTCDISHINFVNNRKVDPAQKCQREVHEATIPVNFAAEPDHSSGIYFHFLPGDKVEAWVSRRGPASTKYPGPAYPKD
jgi:hypothetical protein